MAVAWGHVGRAPASFGGDPRPVRPDAVLAGRGPWMSRPARCRARGTAVRLPCRPPRDAGSRRRSWFRSRAPGIRAAAPRPSSGRRPARCPRRLARGRCRPRDWARSRGLSRLPPPCSAIMRCCPTESNSGQLAFCAAAIASSDIGDQLVGDAPRLLVGLAHDDVHAQPESTSRPFARARRVRRRLLATARAARPRSGRRRSAPRRARARRRRSRRTRPAAVLHRREQEPAALHLLVTALEIHRLAREQAAEDGQELGGCA